MSAAFEMHPISTNLDKAKAIIQKYADTGDANFIQLNKLVKGEITKPELRFSGEVVNALTPDEKQLMREVAQQLREREDYDNKIDYPFLESTLLSKGGKKRSKKRSKKHSKKNRRRCTTSRRRSRARRSI